MILPTGVFVFIFPVVFVHQIYVLCWFCHFHILISVTDIKRIAIIWIV